ncbi:hypothetical protein B0H13DRAFT_2370647 [Mycena leptocephala]|nr:hypothetical protein B0H13DRAFT_2370647 [Mycena leptocephala]
MPIKNRFPQSIWDRYLQDSSVLHRPFPSRRAHGKPHVENSWPSTSGYHSVGLIFRGNDENRKRDPIIRSGLVHFFNYLDCKDPAEREEVVEGAGGTADALAKLIMEYIDFLIPFITTTNGEILNDILHLHGILTFITQIDETSGRGPVADALHENGIGTALAATILAVSTTKHQDMAMVVSLAFILLEKKLVQLNGPRVMRDAVVAGLLRGIVQSCILGIQPQRTSDLLRVALPACTVYYSVVSKLELAIRDVEDLVTDPDFMRSPTLNCGNASVL